MFKRIISILLATLLLTTISSSALAQVYYFQVPKLDIDIYLNDDGTAAILYVFDFINDSSDPIEYVDLGLPNNSFDESQISADIDGDALYYISKSEFQGEGNAGVAIGLESNSIQSGDRGVVSIYVAQISHVFYPNTEESNYASFVFKTPYFVSDVVHSTTDLMVSIHFPPGLETDEPRWYQAPKGFPTEPDAYLDDEGRIVYTWQNSTADISNAYEFGASFPSQYIPESTIVQESPLAWIQNISLDACIPVFCFGSFIVFWIIGAVSGRKRKMRYLPPKITIEGHGIKRGLTAVEASILLEQPLDKVLTMILFGLIKKNAAEVVKKDPLEIKPILPLPDNLYEYEKSFLTAWQGKSTSARQKALETTVIALVKSVSEKMKGFSRSETIEYYKNITNRAWKQVETANTPEVKSQKFDEVMEWTMLDRNYDDRTRDVFRNQPVIIPTWWGRYDPTPAVKPAASPVPSGKPSTGGTSLPHLPGSDFAASIANGVQSFSAGVVGNISDFTSRITNVTNPTPKPSTTSRSGTRGGSSGGHSCACACACACAGCACACAGGGR